jgi:hypothetical protein
VVGGDRGLVLTNRGFGAFFASLDAANPLIGISENKSQFALGREGCGQPPRGAPIAVTICWS